MLQALDYLERALQLCQEMGDTAGMLTYAAVC
jgi:hypothetical protein